MVRLKKSCYRRISLRMKTASLVRWSTQLRTSPIRNSLLWLSTALVNSSGYPDNCGLCHLDKVNLGLSCLLQLLLSLVEHLPRYMLFLRASTSWKGITLTLLSSGFFWVMMKTRYSTMLAVTSYQQRESWL